MSEHGSGPDPSEKEVSHDEHMAYAMKPGIDAYATDPEAELAGAHLDEADQAAAAFSEQYAEDPDKAMRAVYPGQTNDPDKAQELANVGNEDLTASAYYTRAAHIMAEKAAAKPKAKIRPAQHSTVTEWPLESGEDGQLVRGPATRQTVVTTMPAAIVNPRKPFEKMSEIKARKSTERKQAADAKMAEAAQEYEERNP